MLRSILKMFIGVVFVAVSLNADTITTGKILKKEDAGSYSYLQLKTPTETVWAAVMAGNYKVGSEITVKESMRTKKFKSKTLNKTFDNLIFATPVAKGTPSTEASYEKPNFAPPAQTKVYKKAGMKTTVAKLLKTPTAFTNKLVEVTGKVIKVSNGIMKTNWVHVKGESGKSIIFRTTQNVMHQGQKVMAKGIVNTNVDYGYGYKYEIIVVDSVITKI